jgi:hypothetical protein
MDRSTVPRFGVSDLMNLRRACPTLCQGAAMLKSRSASSFALQGNGSRRQFRAARLVCTAAIAISSL